MTLSHLVESPLHFPTTPAEGFLEEREGEVYYRIQGLDALPPFFMSLVSDTDLWLFISSTGALTAGRRDPDQALFPYTTDDRIHDSRDITGGKTLLQVHRGNHASLWEPFSDRHEGLWRIERSLLKSTCGNRILFEEMNLDLELTFRSEWRMSERWGFIRHTTLVNQGNTCTVDVLDGIQNVLPSGLGRRFQLEYSTLADGYKRTELIPDSGLALFRLSSIPVDKAEPCEALRVNVAWCAGLDARTHLLSSKQIGAFRRGLKLTGETDVRGQRGAYLVHATLSLAKAGKKDWGIMADVGLDANQVVALNHYLSGPSNLLEEVLQDSERGTTNLRRIVASGDGIQTTADELSCARHFSNTLFNIMRGGLPADDMRISRKEFQAFLERTNRTVAARFAPFMDSLPERMERAELLAQAEAEGDADLLRLARMYLPLTFSRRHGDPSRPWNIFSIRVKGEDGEQALGYEGNWRDLFQNWEALAHAYPELVDGMIQKFLDASTVDGFNPYRVTMEGFEWEVIDPHDAWSFIGYWGDHQVIYLLKLLEVCHRFQPDLLPRMMQQRVFAFADVPYRLKAYEAMRQDPRRTIHFDEKAHRIALERAASLGTDGLLVTGSEGILRATLAEKLLLVALSKLSNYVPQAGIWMNTQRPEWNDANNALVGNGISVVTLAYLRRYLVFCLECFSELREPTLDIGQELAEFLASIHGVLVEHGAAIEQPVTDAQRQRILDALGIAGETYRTTAYQGLSGERTRLTLSDLLSFFSLALRHVDSSLRANRRPDGLFHAYNLMTATTEGVGIRHLQEMLEGQVAMLSSGLLSGLEAAELLDALRSSALYRDDIGSYLLYPDRHLPRFLCGNILPSEDVTNSALLSEMLEAGDTRLVARDVEGQVHFNPAFSNADRLKEALESLKATPRRALVEAEQDAILAIYERVFDHQSFTGRSGTFYKYEGLGCVYWHMVSKLVLAVSEQRQLVGQKDPDLAARLARHHAALREGLGTHKSPAIHGAIPTDPYSHTPAFAGAQQPGMTGQVKEDILARLAELGVAVKGGQLAFLPWMVRAEEFLLTASAFETLGPDGHFERHVLAPGTLGFSLCQVPVILHKGGAERIQVLHRDGSSSSHPGLTLALEVSRSIFQRRGAIARLDVHLGLA